MGYYLGGIAFERKNFNADRIASGIAKQIEHSKKTSFKGKITKEGSEWIEQNCESLETDVMKLLNGKHGVCITTDNELGVETTEGLMDVYTKKGQDISVGVKNINGNQIELYTIDEGCDPEFYIRISSKDGSQITDDVIKSHVQIFYDVAEGK